MTTLADLGVIVPSLPSYGGCQIAASGGVFVVPGGLPSPVLEITLRDGQGNPIDLSAAVGDPDYAFPLLAREAINGPQTFTFDGTVHNALEGKIRVVLSSALTASAGVYEGLLQVKYQGQVLHGQTVKLLVERNLGDERRGLAGPPLVQEIQFALADVAARNEISRVEFSDEDLAVALVLPVREWNESPPDLGAENTISFPFMEMWLKATCGHLLRSAAASYRRNQFPIQAGGAVIDDQNKEDPYLRAANLYISEWRQFITLKKVEINTRLFYGAGSSAYDGRRLGLSDWGAIGR